jgi:hypothetical protein
MTQTQKDKKNFGEPLGSAKVVQWRPFGSEWEYRGIQFSQMTKPSHGFSGVKPKWRFAPDHPISEWVPTAPMHSKKMMMVNIDRFFEAYSVLPSRAARANNPDFR